MASTFVLLLGLAAAVAIDVRSRRIPNWLTAAIAAGGLGIAAAGGALTIRQAIVGAVVGLALMLPGHLIGATGAGDVKLMARGRRRPRPRPGRSVPSFSRRLPAASSRWRSPCSAAASPRRYAAPLI